MVGQRRACLPSKDEVNPLLKAVLGRTTKPLAVNVSSRKELKLIASSSKANSNLKSPVRSFKAPATRAEKNHSPKKQLRLLRPSFKNQPMNEIEKTFICLPEIDADAPLLDEDELEEKYCSRKPDEQATRKTTWRKNGTGKSWHPEDPSDFNSDSGSERSQGIQRGLMSSTTFKAQHGRLNAHEGDRLAKSNHPQASRSSVKRDVPEDEEKSQEMPPKKAKTGATADSALGHHLSSHGPQKRGRQAAGYGRGAKISRQPASRKSGAQMVGDLAKRKGQIEKDEKKAMMDKKIDKGDSQREFRILPGMSAAGTGMSSLEGEEMDPDRDRSTSPLNEVESDVLEDLSDADAATCPMCNSRVDGQSLNKFARDHPGMPYAQLRKFCHQHKQDSAKTNWEERGYPAIDWKRLDSRIAKHYDLLKRVLEGGRSHYADIYKERVKSKQVKTMKDLVGKTDETLTPGYYGLRGLKIMSENLITHFSWLLRKRAVKDKLIAAAGHTAYVQSVLVPELTVRLIMEDMELSESDAQWHLKSSVDVGELVNEEVEEDVVLGEDSHSDMGLDDEADGGGHVEKEYLGIEDSDSELSSIVANV